MRTKVILMALEAMQEALVYMKDSPIAANLEEAETDLRLEVERDASEQHLFNDLIELYGAEAQMNAFVEELGEVLQAQNKVRRKDTPETREHFAEEIVDVELLLAQMKLLVNPEHLERWKAEKLERIRTRVSKHLLRKTMNLAAAQEQAGGLQNLFNALHSHGVIATQSEMFEIMDAMKKDLSLAEQVEFMESDRIEGQEEAFHLVHDGTTFSAAEEGMEVNSAEHVNQHDYQQPGRGNGIE